LITELILKSPYDLVSIIMFAGIAILFLQRSASRERDSVAVWKYAVAFIGCAVGDVMGNNVLPIPAILVLVAALVFGVVMLKPFARSPST